MTRRANLPDKDKVLIDSVLFDSNNLEQAYLLHVGGSASERPDIIRRMSLRWWRSPLVVAYRQSRTSVTPASDGEKERSTSDIIVEMNRLISLETDNKRRGDLLMKLADLHRESPELNQPESHVSYYLPLRCEACPLWKRFDEAQKSKDPERRKSVDEAWYSDFVDECWRKAHPDQPVGY